MNKYSEKMKSLFFRKVDEGKNESATRKDVAKLEELLQSSLPDDYVDFLLEFGGCSSSVLCPILESFPKVEGRTNEKIPVGVFFSAQSDLDCYNSFDKYKVFQGRIPVNFLPIAYALWGSDLVCLVVKGEEKGKIYLWDREDEIEGEEPGYHNIYLLVNSFDDFINSLEFQVSPENFPNTEAYRYLTNDFFAKQQAELQTAGRPTADDTRNWMLNGQPNVREAERYMEASRLIWHRHSEGGKVKMLAVPISVHEAFPARRQ